VNLHATNAPDVIVRLTQAH